MANLKRKSEDECSGQKAWGKSPQAEVAQQLEPGKVLAVEDEPEILEPLVHSLLKAGFKVFQAEDGLTACRIIGSEQPDLVLLDIMLPDLAGWEVCRLLRQHPDPAVASTPVIMLTALSAAEDKYRGLELGANLFLPKPYSIREVILHAGKLIRARQETHALKNQVEALVNSSRQNQDMHHLLFHELRNQLMILNGYTNLLHENPDNGRAKLCMDAIYRSSNYLQSLAEEVLLIRQVEDGELSLDYEYFPIEELIAEIINVYKTPAAEKAMQLRYLIMARQPPVRLSRLATKIILSSLVDNSLKYGSAGQTITLSCQTTNERIDLSVSDQGQGIPPEEQERVFEPYYRTAGAAGKSKGNGLGLHAVRVLARAMEGDVTLESRVGIGSSFRVHLPAGHP